MNLTVLVPFYNEEVYLESSINRVLKLDFIQEIIMINDGSTDKSVKIAKRLQEKNPNKIKFLNSSTNNGKGNALNLSRSEILTTHLVIHDADLEYFPSDIEEMFKMAKEFPNSLIVGSRFIGNKLRKNIYLRTLIANKVLSFLFSAVYFKRVSDIATCYKLMPTGFFTNNNFEEKSFTIEVELIAKFLNYNSSIKEVPIKYEGRTYEQGKKIKFLDGFKFIYSIFKFRFI